jgi:hypothetical protein
LPPNSLIDGVAVGAKIQLSDRIFNEAQADNTSNLQAGFHAALHELGHVLGLEEILGGPDVMDTFLQQNAGYISTLDLYAIHYLAALPAQATPPAFLTLPAAVPYELVGPTTFLNQQTLTSTPNTLPLSQLKNQAILDRLLLMKQARSGRTRSNPLSEFQMGMTEKMLETDGRSLAAVHLTGRLGEIALVLSFVFLIIAATVSATKRRESKGPGAKRERKGRNREGATSRGRKRERRVRKELRGRRHRKKEKRKGTKA